RAHRIRHVPFVARLLGPQVASAGGASARLWPHCPTLRELPYMAVGSSKWSLEQSAELYNLPGWGHPYFSVREDGTVHVHPNGPEGPSTSLVDVIASAKRQGMSLPLLLRFDGILRHRVQSLSRAFRQAAEEYGYPGRHRPVYPIKVNQQRHVVETL